MKKTPILLLTLLLSCTGLAFAAEQRSEAEGSTESHPRLVRVDCSKGQTLERALNKNADRLVVEFKGTCNEEVLIDRDHTTLRGKNASAEIVGSVTVTGASNIVLRDFTIRDAPDAGLFVLLNSGIDINGLTILNSGARGILLEGSAALIGDTAIHFAGTVGILIRTSRVEFLGTVEVTDCDVAGISSTDGSVVLSNPADVIVERNLFGYVTQLSSETSIANGSLIANNNTVAGILIASHAMFVHGTAVIEANQNQVFGIWVDEVSAWSPFIGFGAQVSASDNGADGVLVQRTATMQFTDATTIENNGGLGIQVDNATLVLGGTTVGGNAGGDVELIFGSRADFAGNTLGSPLICDDTVLVRGDESCPAPRAANSATAQRQSLTEARARLARAMTQ